jgi:hypothetical protein
MYIQYIQGLFQFILGTADYALVTSSLHYNDSLVTWTVIHMTVAKFKPSQSQSQSHITTDNQSASPLVPSTKNTALTIVCTGRCRSVPTSAALIGVQTYGCYSIKCFFARYEIPSMTWNLNFLYRYYKCCLLVPVLNQISLIHTHHVSLGWGYEVRKDGVKWTGLNNVLHWRECIYHMCPFIFCTSRCS